GANILTSIIRMAKGLDLPVVAEGVETALQAEFLKIVDCDFAQGYLFSRPMPANQFKEFFLQYPKKSMEKINIASNLNNILIDDFWDPKSTANYLFNVILSPVGIFEMTEDKLEAVKINDLYFEMIKTTKEEYYKNCNNILHNIYNEDRQLFINAFNQAKLSNKAIDFVYRRIIKNNEMLWIKARCKPVYSNDKKTLFYVVLKNITEEKRKNEMYKMQNEQYKLIIEQTGMLVFDYKINEDTMVYSVENEKGDIVKRRVENYLKYLPSSKVLSKEYLEGFIDHLINARKYESKGYFDFDANFFSEISDGEKYSKYRAYYVSIKNDDNEIFRLVGRIEKILDFGITETSEAVEILKVMYESSPCGICRVNVDNGIKLLYANKQFYKLCGYNEDDLKNKADLFFSNNFISCNNEPNIKTLYNAILKKQPSVLFETQLICKDNVIKNIICGVGITYLKEQTNLNFTIYDITVLKQQQKESLVNKSMYDIAFEKSSVAIWEYDIISQTYRASKAFMKLANYNVDRLTFTKEEATKYITMLNGDITTHLELEKAAQEGKEVEKIVKYKNPFNATKDYWIKILCTPIFDGNGKPIKSIGICQNVSKEKETEKMYNYEKKYREAMNLNSVVFFEIDLTDDNIVLCSDFIIVKI
ncbi:MAG: PAS domain-containing protein, partial [Oscillospiraceae bacterium]